MRGRRLFDGLFAKAGVVSLAVWMFAHAQAGAQVKKIPPPPPPPKPVVRPAPQVQRPQPQQQQRQVPQQQQRQIPQQQQQQQQQQRQLPQQQRPQPQQNPQNRNAQPVFQRNATFQRGPHTVTTDAQGHVRTISDPSHHFALERGPNNVRRVETAQPGGARMVGYGPHYGFRERPLPGRNGYFQRTTVIGSTHYTHVYRDAAYGNFHYHRYVPSVVYGRRFYAWEAHPWRTRVVYAWGWQGQPWYGFYGGYFVPAPGYADASLLLTDYILAQNLQESYAMRQASCDGCDAPTPLEEQPAQPISDDAKAQIAAEVQLEIANEQNGTGPVDPNVVPAALDPKIQTFLVSSSLTLDMGNNQSCALAPGDLLFRMDTTPQGDQISVRVEDSQPGDCAPNTVSQVSLVSLEDMHNHFREVLDAGQQMAAANEGKNGLPAGPPAEAAQISDGQTVDDSADVQNGLMQQQQQADQTEAQLQPASYQTSGPAQPGTQPVPQQQGPAPRPPIQRGQTFAQVVGLAGRPLKVQQAGIYIVYAYDGYRVVFFMGRVANILNGN